MQLRELKPLTRLSVYLFSGLVILLSVPMHLHTVYQVPGTFRRLQAPLSFHFPQIIDSRNLTNPLIG